MKFHRTAAAQIVAASRKSPLYGDTHESIVCVDENLNSPKVWQALSELLSTQHVSDVIPLWHESRIQASGGRILVGGHRPIGVVDGFDFGKPEQHHSWPDDDVVRFALAHLMIYRTVVILTADQGTDPEGLPQILRRDVAPELTGDPSHNLSLNIVFKDGPTNVAAFAQGVRELFRNGTFPPGFNELHI